MTFTGPARLAASSRVGRFVGLADDSPVLAGRVVEPLELAVGDPHDPGVQVVERSQVVVAEHGSPQLAKPVEVGGVDDPVVGAGVQIDGRAGGEIPGERLTGGGQVDHLLDERGQDHVDDGGLQSAADEPAARALGWELAHAVGLHPRLLEQPPVAGELPVDRVVGLGELDVVLDRPALGVLAVEGLVQRDAEAAQDRALLELPRRRSPRAIRAASLSRGRRCGSGSRCARGPTGPARSAPTPGTAAAGSPSSGRRGPGRRGRAGRAARRRGAAAGRTAAGRVLVGLSVAVMR